MKPFTILLTILAMLSGAGAGEAGSATYEPAQFFRTQIQPILERRCYECHSHQHEVEGELALDSELGW